MEEADDIMVQIKAVSSHYTVDPVEAILKDNKMIPGLNGKEVDTRKSYKNMKRVGTFHEGLLEYRSLFPQKKLNGNFGYYIVGGNPKKNGISLLFMIEKNTDNSKIEKVLDILKVKKVEATFFLDGNWFEENNDFINHLAYLNHDLGNLSYNLDYTDSSFIWMDTIMKRVLHRKYGYCYNEKDNKIALDICKLYKNYTIRPSLVLTDNPFLHMKKEVKAGDIISLKITDTLLEELPSMITYIESKGYKIDTLSHHLDETLLYK